MQTDVQIYKAPEKLLQNLIRFNTTNPPGNEADCVLYLKNLLEQAGIEARILAKDEKRLNLYARLKGAGKRPAIMMYGHVDVVGVKDQNWSVDPFEGVIKDGFVWGRGALDMKGPISMMLSAFLKMKIENIEPSGDVILLILSDEEANGVYGAKFLVEEHGYLFKDVKYAIGEIGGFTMYIMGKKLYPVMVSEKQFAHLRLTVKGPAGHASMPLKNTAMSKAARIISKLENSKLPIKLTEPVRLTIEGFSKALGFPANLLMKTLLNPTLANLILQLPSESLRYFDLVMRNTATPTMIQGGHKINVIPSQVTIDLDCRLVPAESMENLIDQMKKLLNEDAEYEVVIFDEGPKTIDMGLFSTISQVLKSFDPDGKPIPFVLPAVTDARFFTRLGIQTYGFTPMKLPEGFDFYSLAHNADERIPLHSLHFGRDAIVKLLQA